MATLFNTKIKDTYQSLLKLEDNSILTTTVKNITDGLGNPSLLYMSTGVVRIGSNSSTAMYWDNTNSRLGIGTISPTSTLQVKGSGSNVSTNNLSIVNSSNTALLTLNDAGCLQVNANPSDNTGFLFNYSGKVGGSYISLDGNTGGIFYFGLSGMNIGGGGVQFLRNGAARMAINSPTAVTIYGSGSTSASTSLLVQNSSGNTSIQVTDDGNLTVTGSSSSFGLNGGIRGVVLGSNASLGQVQLRGDGNYSGFLEFALGTTTNARFGIDYVGSGPALKISNTLTSPFYITTPSTTIFDGSITPTSTLARGLYLNNTLTATANGDTLIGLDVSPTFTNGAYTSVNNYNLRSRGLVTKQYFQSPTVNQGNHTIAFGFGGNGEQVKLIASATGGTGNGNLYIASASGDSAVATTADANALFGTYGNTFYKTFSLEQSTLTSGNGLYLSGNQVSGITNGIYFRFSETRVAILSKPVGGNGYADFRIAIVPQGGASTNNPPQESDTKFMITRDTTNVLINTTTDAGYKLDVNGTTKLTSTLTLENGLINWGNASGAPTSKLRIIRRTGWGTNTGVEIGALNTDTSTYYGAIVVGDLNTLVDNTLIYGTSNNVGVGSVVVVGGGNSVPQTGSSSKQVILGDGNTAGGYTNGQVYGIMIGGYNNQNGFAFTQMYGTNLKAYANGQLLFGANAGPVGPALKEVYIGYGYRNEINSANQDNGNANTLLISPSNASDATDKNGGTLTLAGSRGTGSGTPGSIILSTATGLASGTTLQTLSSRLTVMGGTGNVLIGTSTDAGFKLNVNGSGRVTSLSVGDGVSSQGTISLGQSDFYYPNTLRYQSAYYLNIVPHVAGSTQSTGGYVAIKADNIQLLHDNNLNVYSTTLVNTGDTVKFKRGTSYGHLPCYLAIEGADAAAGYNYGTRSGSVLITPGAESFGNGEGYIILAHTGTTSRGNVLVGTSTQSNASAKLQIESTTQGFLPPRMSTTQKNAISSPATGLQVFDTTMNALCEYNGTGWRVVSAGKQIITASTGATTINLSAGNVADVTLNLSTVITLTNPTVGTYVIKLIQDSIGGKVVSWPFNVLWSGGTPPTLTSTANKTDVITLMYDGSNYYGTYALNF